MNPANLAPFANHLWQSTLFAVAVWLVTLALRRNHAAVRHRLWLAASVKFLIPFSLLADLGTYIERATAVVTAPYSLSTALEAMNQTIEASHLLLVPLVATSALQEGRLSGFLFGVWICGVAVSAVWWSIRWGQLHQIMLRATPLDANVAIPVLCCREHLEPGVFGVSGRSCCCRRALQHTIAAQLDKALGNSQLDEETRTAQSACYTQSAR